MKRLLLADYFRGTDSTGMAAVRADGEIVLSKVDSDPITLFQMEPFKKALNGNASRAFIGHNRAATRGGISKANAHPFHIENIVGAHNGTLCLRSISALEEAVGEKYGTDSELLFAAIAKLGVKSAIKLCYEGKEYQTGAWALSWYNRTDNTLNFLRNKHRTLFMAYEKNFERLFWASEWWMIREALEASASSYEIYSEPSSEKGKVVGYFSFEPDIHYKFDLDELAKPGPDKKKPKPKTTKIAGKPYSSGSQRDQNFTQIPGFMFPNQKRTVGIPTSNATSQKSSGSTTTSRSENRVKYLHLIGDEKHPYANIIDEDQFMPVAHGGCQWCRRPVTFGEPGVTIFERDGQLLCRECSGYNEEMKNPTVKIYLRQGAFDKLG
jgi:predicted glutamine amidotransferase